MNDDLLSALSKRRQQGLTSHLSLTDALAPDVVPPKEAGPQMPMSDDDRAADENMRDGETAPEGAEPEAALGKDDADDIDMGGLLGGEEAAPPTGLRARAVADYKKK